MKDKKMDKRKLNKLRLEFLKKWYILHEKYMQDDNVDTEAFKNREKTLMIEYLGKMGFFK